MKLGLTPARIKAIAAAGAVSIAAAATAIMSGQQVDCSVKAACTRLFESAASEVKCPDKQCVDDTAAAWRAARDSCPPLDVQLCAPFAPPVERLLK